MNPLDYLHLQMALEGKGVTPDNLLIPAPPVTDDFPLILLAKTSDSQCVSYFNSKLAPGLREQIARCLPPGEFPNIESIFNLLRAHAIQPRMGHYKTCLFPPLSVSSQSPVKCLAPGEPSLKSFGFDGFANDVYVIEQDDGIVSACVSVRQNARCAEAWVMTAPEYRGKGLAAQVVMAWARDLMEKGIIPFYSYALENEASARLANKLKLQPVFEEISIESGTTNSLRENE